MNKVLKRLQGVLAKHGVFLYGEGDQALADQLDLRQADGKNYFALYLPALFGGKK